MNNPNHIAIDLETMNGVSLHNWQKQALNTVYGGIKRGEMMTFASGRNTGKSMLTAASIQTLINNMSLAAPSFKVIDTASVDGAPFYTIKCSKEVSIWIRENGTEDTEWYEHIDGQWSIYSNTFDVSQDMLSLIKLTWGDV